MRNDTSVADSIMGGRNSVNPEQSSVASENETELESQLGSGFSGSGISIQEASSYVKYPFKYFSYKTIHKKKILK